MIDAKDAVVWVSRNNKQVMVRPHAPTAHDHADGISLGAIARTDEQRMQLMLVTVIDLTMHGFPLQQVLTAFAGIREFRALRTKIPMSPKLTAALLGTTSLEQRANRATRAVHLSVWTMR